LRRFAFAILYERQSDSYLIRPASFLNLKETDDEDEFLHFDCDGSYLASCRIAGEERRFGRDASG
jgi:hypothetical protein